MPAPIQYSGEHLDLSPRYLFTKTVVASPAAAAETIIAQTPQLGDLQIGAGVVLDGWAAFTVGTNGTACRFRIRRTDVNGTVIADTGALTGGIAAAALVAQDVSGVDTAAVAAGQVWVLTLQVTAGSAASTVSAVKLDALAI